MMALPDRYDDDATAELERRALEKMVAALCEDIDRLVHAAGELESREARFQSEAFRERRAQAMALLEAARPEPDEVRISRLEKMVEALRSSREYFRAGEPR